MVKSSETPAIEVKERQGKNTFAEKGSWMVWVSAGIY